MSSRAVAVLVAVAIAGSVASGQQQRPPTFRGSAVLVTVDAYPQQNGRIVEGLTADDFEVFEDGKPQKVENFDFVRVDGPMTEAERRDPRSVAEALSDATEPRNRVFVVYLDRYHVTFGGAAAVHRPIVDTLGHLLAAGDLFAVMTPNMSPRDLTFARQLDALENQVSRYADLGRRDLAANEREDEFLKYCFGNDTGGNLSGARPVADGAVIRQMADVLIARRREDLTLTSLEQLVDYVGHLREARTVVLLFTDGWQLFEPDDALLRQPNTGRRATDRACNAELVRLAGLDDRSRFRELITTANRRNVTFYPVTPEGLAAFDAPINERVSVNPNARPDQTVLNQDLHQLRGKVQALKELAENTDGIAVTDTNDLAAGVRKVVADVSSYYVLGYYSTNQKLDGAYHRIQVKTKRAGTAVKARRGYFAPTEAALTAKSTPVSSASAAASAAVSAALASLPAIRPDAELVIRGVARRGELDVIAEIPEARLAAGKWMQGGEARALVTTADGQQLPAVTARVDTGARSTVLPVPLAAAARGPWRVTVTFTAGGDRLEDRETIDVEPSAGLLDSPIVYRAAPGPRSPVRPVADMQFRRTERAHIEWPVNKPLDARQARLLSRAGQPLAVTATVSDRDTNGASMLAVDVNLAPLSAGDYLIEVTAGSGAETETRVLPIRIVQ